MKAKPGFGCVQCSHGVHGTKLPTHRRRRGKLVEIPLEWRGHFTTNQTICKRKSKKGQGAKYKRKAMR